MSKLAEDLSQGGSNKKVQSKSMYFEQGEYVEGVNEKRRLASRMIVYSIIFSEH